MAKQSVRVELFYDGSWHSAPAYVRAPISIARGRGPEAHSAEPATATLTLDNRDGTYNPRNPSSPLYGLAGRNTPLRIAVLPGYTTGAQADARDDFSADVTDDWGTADVGGDWTWFGLGGSVLASDFQVASGVATHNVTAANAYRATYLGDLSILDATQAVTFTAPQATGSSLSPANFIFRGESTTSYLMARVFLTSTNVVSVQALSANGTVLGAETVSGLTHAGTGTPLRAKARVVGRDVFIKVWDPAGAEPDGWHLRAVDTTADPIAGFVGIRSGRSSGNTNSSGPQFSYDDYEVTVEDARFFGEVSSWRPDQTVDFEPGEAGGDAWTEIEASGVLRRLAQGRDPRSAAYRAVTGYDPIAYWPLDDADGSAAASSALSGVAPMRPLGASQYQAPVTGAPIPPAGLPAFGNGLTPAGARPGIDLTGGGRLDGGVPPSSQESWEVQWTMAFGVNAGGVLSCEALWILSGQGDTGDAADKWIVNADSTQVTVFLENGGSVIGTLVTGRSPYDGVAHHYSIWATNNGANVDIGLMVDGVQVDSDSLLSTDFSTVSKIVLNGLEDTGNHMPIGMSDVVVFAPFLPTNDDTEAVAWATHGHPGEPAGERIERLAEQEGIGFEVTGTASDTVPLGPQTYTGVPEVMAEAERTDDGVLSDLPYRLGLHYRTGRSLVNQGAVLTLDYSAGEVAPPLRPVIDDLGVFNDVTAIRPDGASARVTRDTGPLNTQSPEDDPNGVGRYATQVEVNPQTEFGLAASAGWMLNKSGVDEVRYSEVTVDLDAKPALAQAASAVMPGDQLHITNLHPDTIELVVTQIREEIGSHRRKIIFSGVPASPYRVVELDHAEHAFLSSGDSTVAADFDAGTDTVLSVDFGNGNRWDDADAPYDVMAAGVRLTVTSVFNQIGGNDLLTVTQAPVNGVIKTIPAGAEVDIYPAAYVGM